MTTSQDSSLDEIDAMRAIAEALAKLDDDARQRALHWAGAKFGVQTQYPTVPVKQAGIEQSGDSGNNTSISSSPKELPKFNYFAELYSAAQPSTDVERVLVGGYWFQFIQGESEIDSFSINKELANLGHRVNGINHAFDSLKSQKPNLAIQLKKSGSAKQARKKYKITTAGKQAVEDMIRANPANG